MSETPSFKVVRGRGSYRWITDRGRKIALVGLSGPAYIIDAIHLRTPTGTVPDPDEPEVLHNYTIRGTRLTLGWFQNEVPVKPVLGWDDTDPRRLRMWVEENGPDGERVGEYRWSVTLDPDRRSYVHDFESRCAVPKAMGLEYVNFTVVGVDDTRPGKTRYPATLYQDAQGEWIGLPRHHCTTSELYDKDVPHGHFIGFFGEKDNPVLEILDAPSSTYLNVCMCLHDVHVCGRSAGKDSAGRQTFLLRYRLYGVDEEVSAKWMAAARRVRLSDEEVARFAAFSPSIELGASNDMEKGIDVRTDGGSFYFERQEYNWENPAFWDTTCGHSGTASVRIVSATPGRRSLGVSGGQIFVTPKGSVDLAAWVRTEKLQGRGAYLEVEFGRWAGDRVETLQAVQSARVTGDADWTLLELKGLPVPERAEYAWVRLAVEGPGSAWFDDLLVRVREPLAAMALPVPARAERVPVRR
ncbi:MAG: hypothetical protein HYU36_07890 [Planctomycetes bacterium]|nr:hypothetical protein [Planctomycetota bacterium]